MQRDQKETEMKTGRAAASQPPGADCTPVLGFQETPRVTQHSSFSASAGFRGLLSLTT